VVTDDLVFGLDPPTPEDRGEHAWIRQGVTTQSGSAGVGQVGIEVRVVRARDMGLAVSLPAGVGFAELEPAIEEAHSRIVEVGSEFRRRYHAGEVGGSRAGHTGNPRSRSRR